MVLKLPPVAPNYLVGACEPGWTGAQASWTVTRVALYVIEFVNERPVYGCMGEAELKGSHEE